MPDFSSGLAPAASELAERIAAGEPFPWRGPDGTLFRFKVRRRIRGSEGKIVTHEVIPQVRRWSGMWKLGIYDPESGVLLVAYELEVVEHHPPRHSPLILPAGYR